MTDFVDDLERELLAAARRRTARERRVSRALRLKVDARGAFALFALAALAAAVLFVVRPAPDVERPATSQRGFVPPVASAPSACKGAMVVTDTPTPRAVIDALAVLRRKPGPTDGLPGGTLGWLPIGSYAHDSARRVGDVVVVPTGDVRDRSTRCEDSRSLGPGACVVSERPTAGRCFTLDEIRQGRAIAVAPTEPDATLLALLPDGAAGIDLSNGLHMMARDNAVAGRVQNLRAGQPIEYLVRAAGPEVLILNETTVAGLASAARAELLARRPELQVSADTGPPGDRRASVVQAASAWFVPLAREVAADLRIPYGGIEPSGVGVTVHLGIDRTR